MPLYEYKCEACGNRFEKIVKFSDPPIEACPECGGGVTKLLSSPAIQFKGSGWYITDYAKKPATDTSKSTGSDKAADSTSEAAKPESTSGTSAAPAAKD